MTQSKILMCKRGVCGWPLPEPIIDGWGGHWEIKKLIVAVLLLCRGGNLFESEKKAGKDPFVTTVCSAHNSLPLLPVALHRGQSAGTLGGRKKYPKTKIRIRGGAWPTFSRRSSYLHLLRGSCTGCGGAPPKPALDLVRPIDTAASSSHLPSRSA